MTELFRRALLKMLGPALAAAAVIPSVAGKIVPPGHARKTPAPTAQPTLVPALTSTPTLTATATDTATPTSTPTPGPTDTPAPFVTPTATPTPDPLGYLYATLTYGNASYGFA
jgi:hypothetical protein